MTLKEENRDLFSVDDKYYLAHCISMDCAMGRGIAAEFERRFSLRNRLLWRTKLIHAPSCIKIGRIYNLITKRNYYDKPTYKSLKEALTIMKEDIILYKIKYLAMPKIGCGLDRLHWDRVKEIIEELFQDIDIEILVCYL